MEMLDETTHEKGAAVLDMLRYLVDGSEAASHPASQNEVLFRALHHYLTTHHAQTADTPDLIESIRNVIGEELGWFFREWVFAAGRPEYRVGASYDAARKIERVTVTQAQQISAETPIFDMPIELAFYQANGQGKKIQVRDNSQRQEFEIPLGFEPQWVDFDPDNFIDKTVEFAKPENMLIAQAGKDPSMMGRLWAVEQLGLSAPENPDARAQALVHVLGNDGFYGVRVAAATSLGSVGTEKAKIALLAALPQPDSRVREAVVAALGNFAKDQAVCQAIIQALHDDSSYAVQAAAARALGKSGMAQAFDILSAKAKTNPEVHVMRATLAGLVATKDPRAAEVLLAQAQPGRPEPVRISALGGLANLKETIAPDHLPELI